MANFKVNNLKVYSPTISKILREDRYDADDVTAAEMNFVAKHQPKPRIPRMDLTPGDIVVVLEGIHSGKKTIFIKQLPDCKAIVTGISSINGVPAFKIDERYLLKLSAKITIPSNLSYNPETLYESKMNENEKIDSEPAAAETAAEKHLLNSVSKVKYMKSYLSEPFKVDNSCEFYSLDY